VRIDEPNLDADDIQGHILVGFGGGYQALVGLRFRPETKAAAKAALLPWVDRVTSTRHALAIRRHRREAPTKFATASLNEVQVAMALTAGGLAELTDNPGPDDAQFRQGAAKAAVGLGDAVDSAGRPVGWVVGDKEETTPHVLVVFAASESTVDAARTRLLADLEGLVQIVYDERGLRLPFDREHFGFVDGISQVGVRGTVDGVPLTSRHYTDSDPLSATFAKPGQPLVWPGQFVFGYPVQLSESPEPGPVIGNDPLLRNGSLLVFRRLRQDVAAFRAAMTKLAAEYTAAGVPTDAATAAALVVGRWPDGTPVSLSPKAPDPAISGDPHRINGFLYDAALPAADLAPSAAGAMAGGGLPAAVGAVRFPGAAGDLNGLSCPFFAHVRKVNPRDQAVDQGSSGVTLRSQMLRRGVPYGTPFSEDETAVPPSDRGLLFLAYQTSIENQFNRLMTLWVNSRNAPPPGEGEDALLSADRPQGRALSRRTSLTTRVNKLLRGNWISATGGGYFLTAGIRTLNSLLSS
jgi:Dyp-type peroxidase family